MIPILRWVWVGVLSVLLLASILYHAPWKVIGLIAVFLVACTVLPCRHRKYFWASIGLIVLALAGWVFWPDESRGWRPYVFEKETEAFLGRYRVSQEKNAALIYEDLHARWEADDPNEPNVPDDWYGRARSGPWRSEEHPDVAAWLDHHEPTVKRLVEASGFEQCFFEDGIRNRLIHPYSTDLPPVAEMRQLAFLLGAAANRDWGERGLEPAMTKQLASFKFGLHLSSQPESLFILTGTAIEMLALAQLNRAMIDGSAGAAYLDRVDREVAGIDGDWRPTFRAILEQERLHMKNSLAAFTYQVNDAGRVRYSRDPLASVRDQMRDTLERGDVNDQEALRRFNEVAYPGYWGKKAVKVGIILAMIVFPSAPEKMGKAIDNACERYALLLDPAFDNRGELRSPHSVMRNSDQSRVNWDFMYFVRTMAGIQEEAYHSLSTILRKAETTRRATRAIAALCRYRNERHAWPPALEAAQAYGKDAPFVDAWGRPFVYKPDGDGFVLYSTGENGLDEKGESKVEYSEDYVTSTVVVDDISIWPPPVREPEPRNDEKMKKQLEEIYGRDPN